MVDDGVDPGRLGPARRPARAGRPLQRPATGLLGYVAIHSTALGPALGGTRFYPTPTRRPRSPTC